MLAPRKKLWSTPAEAIDKAIELLHPTELDQVYDIGAGDGNFIIKCAQKTKAKVTGIEIESERVASTASTIATLGFEDNCKIICANALEIDYTDATCIFMYLIPRGLRLIEPILQQCKKVRVVTFMNPLPSHDPIRTEKIATEQHPDAAWPLYYYELNQL